MVVRRRVDNDDVERGVSRLAGEAEGVGRELFAGVAGVRGLFAGERVYGLAAGGGGFPRFNYRGQGSPEVLLKVESRETFIQVRGTI